MPSVWPMGQTWPVEPLRLAGCQKLGWEGRGPAALGIPRFQLAIGGSPPNPCYCLNSVVVLLRLALHCGLPPDVCCLPNVAPGPLGPAHGLDLIQGLG